MTKNSKKFLASDRKCVYFLVFKNFYGVVRGVVMALWKFLWGQPPTPLTFRALGALLNPKHGAQCPGSKLFDQHVVKFHQQPGLAIWRICRCV